LDGFAVDDVNTVVIRTLRSPVAACVAPAQERKDGPELDPWSITMTGTTSAPQVALIVTYGAWSGDVPLVPYGSVSDELAAGIRFFAETPLSIIP
jgi:hypothetical protein